MNPILWLLAVAIKECKRVFSNDPKSVANRDGVVRTNPIAIAVGNATWTIMAILKVVAIGVLVVLGGIVWLVWYQEQPAQKKAQAMEDWVTENSGYLRQSCDTAVQKPCSDWENYEYPLIKGWREVSWRDFTIPADTPKAELFPCWAYVGISDKILCDFNPERKGTLLQAAQQDSIPQPQVESTQQPTIPEAQSVQQAVPSTPPELQQPYPAEAPKEQVQQQDAPTSASDQPQAPPSSAQPQFAFHASPMENIVSPSQSDINNAPRLVLLCVKNGQRSSVGLFEIDGNFWINTYDSTIGPNSGMDFYTFAAFREQGLGELFLEPSTFRVGSYQNVEPFSPMVVQACRSGIHIFADTGTRIGILDACTTR